MKKIILKRRDPNNPQIKAYSRAVENGYKTQHVLPSKNGWVVKKAGASKASKVFEKQDSAIKFGTKIAKNNKTELIVHGKDGRIRERNSYGNDPHPPRG